MSALSASVSRAFGDLHAGIFRHMEVARFPPPRPLRAPHPAPTMSPPPPPRCRPLHLPMTWIYVLPIAVVVHPN